MHSTKRAPDAHVPPQLRSRRGLMAAAVLLTLVLAGCRSGESRETLVIFGAASLTDAFNDLKGEFEREHARVDIKTNFAGSQSLRAQIENGATPHIYASANAHHMELLSNSELVNTPQVFAHNVLVVVVPPHNPAKIHSFADLPNAQRLVIAGPSVPAGIYTLRVLENAKASLGPNFTARVNKAVVSRETHVRQTLQKVVLGEADAALVYATDAASVGAKVTVIQIPKELNIRADYSIATLPAALGNSGERFMEFVLSAAGQKHLTAAGFLPLE